MRTLRLRVRTPEGLVLDREVKAVRVEDADGWVGILPGRRDLIALLVPGLVLFDDEAREGYVAVSGGLLELTAGECRVMVGDARLARDPSEAAEALAALLRARRERSERRRAVLDELEREALRRVASAVREPSG
ncbi:MAG TPA: hypothetical protein VIL20_30350 [Sandaracinaceae bacterium]